MNELQPADSAIAGAGPPAQRPDSLAVVMERPGQLALSRLPISEPTDRDVVVDIDWSGISTGTERLLWRGSMPEFPGLGYPLVPGYESVGRVIAAGVRSGHRVGATVFVPGASCFGSVRGLFGGAARTLVAAGDRVCEVDERLGEQAVLLALAATAWHALSAADAHPPELIVGHGVLGRLIARLTVASGAPAPVVWERTASRRAGAVDYTVVDPADDAQRRYRSIYDVSGDAALLDTLIGRLDRGGTIVLAGFYDAPLSFAFAPAFMREARLRVAAEWQPADLVQVRDLVSGGRLSLDGLITHRRPAAQADDAYRTAFDDAGCLKMVLDWRACS